MIAAMMRRSLRSAFGISSTIRPREITTTRSHNPASSIGSLDLTMTAVPSSAFAQRVVDVETGPDVDALGGLVGQDHVELAAQERAQQRDLLLVAAGQVLRRLLDRRRLQPQPGARSSSPVVSPAAADETETGEALEDQERGVGAHAEGGEDRLRLAVGAEQDDAGRTVPVGCRDATRLPAQ